VPAKVQVIPAAPEKKPVTPQVQTEGTGHVLPGFVGAPHAAPKPIDLEKLGPAMRGAEIRSRKDGLSVTFRGETWTYNAAKSGWYEKNGDGLGVEQLISHLRDLAERPAPAPAAENPPREPIAYQGNP